MGTIYFDETEIISRQIAEASNDGKPLREFLLRLIAEFEGSDFYSQMAVAQRYYDNNNDINEHERYVLGRDPETGLAVKMKSEVLADNKLNHGFMKKLTRQKIGYMLGKPFSLSVEKENQKDEAEAFFELLYDEYFDADYFKLLKNVARDSIVKQLGWLHVYYNESGELKFKRMNPEEIIPLWADSDHTVLDAVIRKYKVESYEGATKVLYTYVDYYTLEAVYHFVYDGVGTLKPVEGGFKTANFNIQVQDDETKQMVNKPAMWTRIPFIPFKYDVDEKGLLNRIKSLVDDYDRKTSDIANEVDDFPNSLLLIKNYDGKNKEEFTHNKNMYRTIFVQGDGDAKALEMKMDIEQVDKHLQRLREDIYEFGQGVNTADKDIRDTSGVALRFMYADLDMDCLDWGSEVEWSIKKLIWFIQQDMIRRGLGDFTKIKFSVVFNTDVIINETETIQNCFTSMGVISQLTIAANHPWTISAEKELAQFMDQTEETLDLEATYAKKAAVKASSSTTGQRSGK